MTFSIWHQSVGRDARVDVAIIGGGISGLSAAHWIRARRPQARIHIFERGRLGSGASGRNAGFMTCGSIAHFDRHVHNLGLDDALALWTLTQRNHAELLAAGFLSEACGYRQTGAYSLSRSTDTLHALSASAAALQHAGADVRVLPSDGAPLPGYEGGYWYGGDGQLNPMGLMAAFRERQAATLHEGTEVLEVESTTDGVELRTSLGTWRARVLIVATNGYTPQWIPQLRPWVSPTRAQALSTVPAKGRLDAPVYALDDWAYLRQTEDGALVLGGFRPLAADEERGVEDRIHPGIHAALDDYLRAHCGPLFDGEAQVTHRWSGVLGYAPDALPIVGEIPSIPHGYFIGAHSGHGMGWGFIAAQLLTALVFDGARPGPLDSRRFGGRPDEATD